MNTKILLSSFALSSAMFLALPCVSFAQDDSSSAARTFEEITVTARKREETITDVPMYINAMTAEGLEAAGISDPTDFVGKISGISKSGDFFSPGKEFMMMVIRGVGSNGGMEPAAPVFLDGVYMPRLGLDTAFMDVERVEILYGPQSTLFGRNTEAGAISIITRRPSEETRGKVQFEVDDFATFKTKASVSGQIADNWFAGLAVEAMQTDGYLDNAGATRAHSLLGSPPGGELSTSLTEASDPDAAASIGGRMSLRWVPSDNFEAFLTVDSQRWEGGAGAPGVPRDCNCYELDVEGVFDGYSENEGAMLRLDYTTASELELTSITSYRKLRTSTPFDFDGGSSLDLDGGTPLDMTLGGGQNIPGITNSLQGNYQDFRFDQEIVSQELRISSVSDRALQWLIGAYLFDESFFSDRNVDIVGANGFPFFLRQQQVDADRDGWAIFGQATYDISDTVQVALGLRYSDEDSSADSSLFWETPFFANYPNQNNGGANSSGFSYDDTNYSASIRWNMSDSVTAFFTTGTAFKSGGYALGPTGTLPADEPYSAETATSYELGFKALLLDNRLKANLTFFNIDLEDQQVRTTKQVGDLIFGVTANAANATSKGMNLDAQFYASENVLLTLAVGYTDASFGEFITANGLDFSGEAVRFVPEWTYNLGIDWTLLQSGGWFDETTLYVNWQYVDEQIQGFDNIAVDVEFAIEEYDIFNVGARFKINDHATATLFVNNVADKYIQSKHWNVFFFSGPGGANRVMSTVMPPRNVGLRFTYEF